VADTTWRNSLVSRDQPTNYLVNYLFIRNRNLAALHFAPLGCRDFWMSDEILVVWRFRRCVRNEN